jgi:hypothetical protein
MNEIFEMWSLPWHALQRSLATRAGTDASGFTVAGRSMRNAPDSVGPQVSWLVRAPARVQPSARRGL